MRTIESPRLAAMSSKFPDPPSEAVFAAVVAQAELDVAHAKPKGREPNTVNVPGGFRLGSIPFQAHCNLPPPCLRSALVPNMFKCHIQSGFDTIFVFERNWGSLADP
jgi:hypothetical protein